MKVFYRTVDGPFKRVGLERFNLQQESVFIWCFLLNLSLIRDLSRDLLESTGFSFIPFVLKFSGINHFFWLKPLTIYFLPFPR